MAGQAEGLFGLEPSKEQRAMVAAFAGGSHILCSAVAGAGKTTALLLGAATAPERPCLLLTYNKRLQLEVSLRARRAGLGWVVVSTYHAAAGKAYGGLVRTDEDFRRVLGAPPEAPQRFSALLLDEAQDLTYEYFAFVRYLLWANPGAQLVVVGDPRQSIGEYRGARPEFLTEAPALFAPALGGARPWARCRLRESYRLTPATAAFVNAQLYREDVLVGKNLAAGEGPRPVYLAVRGGRERMVAALASAVSQALGRYGPEGVFVLAASVRGLADKRSPLALLVRHHLAGVPTYIASGDEERVSAELIAGKLAVMSFNASKGCERPCVVLVNFDEGHFRFCCRDWDDPARLPNVMTVAATRAKAQLILVANASLTLRTVDVGSLDETARVRGSPARCRARRPAASSGVALRSVTDLLRHLHPETVVAALGLVQVSPAPRGLAGRLAALGPAPARPSGLVRFGAYTESLSFAYGLIAPALAELARTGSTQFGAGFAFPRVVADGEAVRPLSNDITRTDYETYPARFWEHLGVAASAPPADRTSAEWCTLAVAGHAFEEGRHHIARQVADYDWVDGGVVAAARDTVLAALADPGGRFEVALAPARVGSTQVAGRADFVDDAGVVWEFKLGPTCEAHVLQLAAYLALGGGGEGVLLSLLERQAQRVSVCPEDAAELLRILVEKARGPMEDIFATVAAADALLGDPGGPADDERGEGGPDEDDFDCADVYG